MTEVTFGVSSQGTTSVAPPSPESIRELEDKLKKRSGGPLFQEPQQKQPRTDSRLRFGIPISPSNVESPNGNGSIQGSFASPQQDAPTTEHMPGNTQPENVQLQMQIQLQELQDALTKERKEKERLVLLLRHKEQDHEAAKAQIKKLQDAFVEKVRQSCTTEREQEQHSVHQKFYTLGQVVVQRDMSEVWHDGRLLKDTKAKLEKLRDELDEVKKRSQEKKKEEKKKGKVNADDDDCAGEEELLSLQLLQNNLQKEEAVLQAEMDSLDVQKHVFIKDIKRIRNEDASRFNKCPVLNERYVLERLLGRGGFSEVYQAFDLVEVRTVACKIHQLNSTWSPERKHNYIKHARREYDIHKTLVHPRVIQLYDVFDIDNHTFATILEYCNGVDLDLYLKKTKCISEKEAKVIMYQVFCGLKYLNERPEPIIHYDLKPGNILVGSDMKVKITDFGLSKIIPSQDETHIDLTSQGAGTYWYLPPECFETGCTPKISAKVDVWGAAVVFYQILYGRKPFGNDVSQQQLVMDRIILNAHTVEFPAKPTVGQDTKDFIRRLLCHNQNERPDIFAVCQDPYFQKTPKRKAARDSTGSKAPVSP
uniref:Protein kinase domain-containing protein n=1 Tax=Eutreptiella gymnastica TaxID=73025 RepID=A0A7S1ISB4_9EUGL